MTQLYARHSNLKMPVKPSWSERALRAAALMGAIAVTACATTQPSAPPEDTIKARATERWQALVAGEYTRAYTYNTPGYRAVVSADRFRDRINPGAAKWLGAQAVSVQCTSKVKCEVKVRIDYKVVLSPMGPLSTHIDETWLLEDGQWWYFQQI